MSEDARRIFGNNLRKLREAAKTSKGEKISQAELAARMGVDRAYISLLELGKGNPTVVTLWHLGKALGVPMSAFLEEKPRRVR